MQVHFGVDLLHAEWAQSVTCMGTFDGVHVGHREVVSQAVRLAESRGLPCVLLTFDRHPAAVLAPERCPAAIASVAHNLRNFDELGVSLALVMPFTPELARTTADQFYREVILGSAKASAMVVGHDFAFGHDRVGTTEWLSARMECQIVPPFEIDGQRVSSSAVRRAVRAGEMEVATRLLGRPFAVEGVVVHGAQLGRTLGYPTINLARSFRQVEPDDGVYAGFCETSNGVYRAAISIGVRPTVDETSRTIEAYLIDYTGESLYGHSVTLSIERRLRDQTKFHSLDALKEQMALDVQSARG